MTVGYIAEYGRSVDVLRLEHAVLKSRFYYVLKSKAPQTTYKTTQRNNPEDHNPDAMVKLQNSVVTAFLSVLKLSKFHSRLRPLRKDKFSRLRLYWFAMLWRLTYILLLSIFTQQVNT
jgi:hypothetical protein